MALHYPTDITIYACVLTDDPATRIPSKDLRDYCQSKIPQHDWGYSGNREHWQNLANMRQLEQAIGKEIIWVAAHKNFDAMLKHQSFLPNSRARFCTTHLKIEPIYWYLYAHYGRGVIIDQQTSKPNFESIQPFYMQIGFRHGEESRVDNQCLPLRIPIACNLFGQRRTKWLTTKNLRISSYPLIDNKISHTDISNWASKSDFKFPKITDCDFCFFRTKSEIMSQAIEYPDRASWWLNWEAKTGHTWSGKSTKKTVNSCGCEL